MKSGEEKLTYKSVFDFPIETDNIFRLFLLAMLGITVIIGNYIPSFLFETDVSPLAIFPLTEFYDADKVFNASPAEFFGKALLFLKPISIQLIYVCIIFSVSFIVYKRKPGKIIRENNLSLIRDENIIEFLELLRKKAGINKKVNYYVNGNIRDFSAQVFGTGSDLYLKTGRGLIKIISTKNYDLFESIIMHEFSHIRNNDIPKTYFAESVLKAPFLITLISSFLVMFYALVKSITEKTISGEITFTILLEKLTIYLNLFVQISALLLLLFLIFRMLIRSREFYADLRTASWKDSVTLIKYFDKAKEDIRKKNFIIKIFGYHPSIKLRSEMLSDPLKIFKPSVKILFLNTLVSYIFITVSLIFGISFILLVTTIGGYSLLFLFKGILNETVHLLLVYFELIMGTIVIILFILLCGNIIRKTFFSQVDKILITQKYDKSKKSFIPELIKLSMTASVGIITGYLLLPLFGFNILYVKNLVSIPFVFMITFFGFILLNLFHYYWMHHKILNEYEVDFSVPVMLRLFEGVSIVIIFLSSILSFMFFSSLIFG